MTENVVVTPSPSNNGDEDASEVADLSFSMDSIKRLPPATTTCAAGETSPTSVNDLCIANYWKDSTVPHWFSTGADVEQLLDDADALDWLSDSGDLDETYGHILSSKLAFSSENVDATDSEAAAADVYPAALLASSTSAEHGSMSLPSLFDHALDHPNQHHPQQQLQPLGNSNKRLKISMSCFLSATEAMEASLPIVPSSGNMIVGDEHFAAFDGGAFDEQAFVSALLDSNASEPSSLPTLS